MNEGSPPEVAGFEELTLLAIGGFGAVYRAVDKHIGRVVAIKVLDDVNIADSRSRDRFLRETRAMGKLSGLPNIVDIYQATFASDGRPCIVMPLLAGGSLADALSRRGSLSADEVITLGARVARALDSAHRRGISHRDIKPENILLDEVGEPGLADFGIAIATDTAASTRTRMSLTPEHAPPERLAPPAGNVPPESLGDIYSLGSTLFTLLAGHNAFGSEAEIGTYEFIRRVVEQPAPPTGRADIPAELDAVLRRALAKSPADRYASALDFAAALEAIPHNRTRVHGPLGPATQTVSPPDPDAVASSDVDGLVSPNVAFAVPQTTRAKSDRPGSSLAPPVPLLPPLLAATTPASTIAPGRMLPDPPPLEPSSTVYRERPEVPESHFPDEDLDPSGPPRWAVYIGVPVMLLLGLVGFNALRNSNSSAVIAPTTITPGGRAGPGDTGPGTAEKPTVDSVKSLADGGLSFTWVQPGGQEGPPNFYQIFVDDKPANPTEMQVDDATGEIRQEQWVRDITIGTITEKVDPAAHRYCVVVRRITTVKSANVDSLPKCLDAETSNTTESSALTPNTSPPASIPAVPAGATITGGTPCPATTGSEARTTKFAQPPPQCLDNNKEYTAVVHTTKGDVQIRLNQDQAPNTVNNFVVLARYHYYDGAPITKIIPRGWMEFGDTVKNEDGSTGPGYAIPGEGSPASTTKSITAHLTDRVLQFPPQVAPASTLMVSMVANPDGTISGAFMIDIADQSQAVPKRDTIFGLVLSDMVDPTRPVESQSSVHQEVEKIATQSGEPSEVVTITSIDITESDKPPDGPTGAPS